MKKLLLATLLAISTTADARLTSWSVDQECVASSVIDWSKTNSGAVLLTYDLNAHSINIGVQNRDFGFTKKFTGPVLLEIGGYPTPAQAHGFHETQLLVFQIPYNRTMESHLITAKAIKVYAQKQHFLTLELTDVDQALENIYACYGARKA